MRRQQKMTSMPWNELQLIALKCFGIAPQDFWHLTPCELKGLILASGACTETESIARGELEVLMRQFPDY